MPSPRRIHHHAFHLLASGGQGLNADFARIRRGLGLDLDGDIRIVKRGLRRGVVMHRENLDRAQVVTGHHKFAKLAPSAEKEAAGTALPACRCRAARLRRLRGGRQGHVFREGTPAQAYWTCAAVMLVPGGRRSVTVSTGTVGSPGDCQLPKLPRATVVP